MVQYVTFKADEGFSFVWWLYRTCGIHLWRDSQKHRAGIWRQGLLNFLQEGLTVETAGNVCDGGHACLTLHTWARGTMGCWADAFIQFTITYPWSTQPMSRLVSGILLNCRQEGCRLIRTWKPLAGNGKTSLVRPSRNSSLSFELIYSSIRPWLGSNWFPKYERGLHAVKKPGTKRK